MCIYIGLIKLRDTTVDLLWMLGEEGDQLNCLPGTCDPIQNHLVLALGIYILVPICDLDLAGLHTAIFYQIMKLSVL